MVDVVSGATGRLAALRQEPPPKLEFATSGCVGAIDGSGSAWLPAGRLHSLPQLQQQHEIKHTCNATIDELEC